MKCRTCGIAKAIVEFRKNGRGGYKCECKECANAEKRARYAGDPDVRQRAIESARKNQKPYSQWPESWKARVNETKRMGRINGAPGYKPRKHDAHVKQWIKVRREAQWMLRNIQRKLTPARSQEERDQRRRDRDNRNVELLTDKYVKHLIVKSLPVLKGVKLPQSLCDLERARLMIVREIASRRKLDEELQ